VTLEDVYSGRVFPRAPGGPLLACLTALAASGCASIYVVATTGEVFHAQGSVSEEEAPARKAAIASAAHDIPCAAASVTIAQMPQREHLQYGGREVVADGCGSRITYLESCDGVADGYGKATCTYVMTGRMSLASPLPASSTGGAQP
jgi:hypothetical protein